MTVGIKIGGVTSEVGTGEFFNAFFSTVHYHLEKKDWGERFPVIMHGLYQGTVTEDKASAGLLEIDTISSELARLSPGQLIWDIENLQAKPPWGDKISSDITDLSNYFVTSTGRDLIDTIRECLDSSVSMGGDIKVVTY